MERTVSFNYCSVAIASVMQDDFARIMADTASLCPMPTNYLDTCLWRGCPDPRVTLTVFSRCAAKLIRNRDPDPEGDLGFAAAGWRVLRVRQHMAPDTAVAQATGG